MTNVWKRVLLMCVAATVLLSSAAVGVPTPTHVRFAAAGDFGDNADAARVLDAADDLNPDAFFAVGDLSYGATGAEQAWCDFVTARLGAGYPFELLAGNHESNGQNGNINDFSACLPNQLPGAVGTYGREYFVDVPQQDPLVRFLMISPGMTFPDGTWSYGVGTQRYAWLSSAIDQARNQGIEWVVVGMHYPCLSPGMYTCSPGPDVVNLLLMKKVDVVLSGHEHFYARTKQLALGAGCTSLAIGSYDPDCVEDADNELLTGAGTVFLTVGTGGRPLRAVDTADSEIDYFAAYDGSNTGGVHGFADVELTPDELTVNFVRATDGGSDDAFTITRDPNPPPPNELPTAAFTSTSSGLTATMDASGSTDPDGVVTSYLWSFGDDQTGTGPTPSHTYATAGTYDVTLTVTDDDGGTASVTQQVTVTAPPTGSVIAQDAFARTIVNGWGSADVGGTWTVSPANGVSSVADGTARLVMAAAGSRPVSVLGSVSARDLDARFVMSLDKRPTPSSSRIDQFVLLRRNGTTEYRGMVRVLGTGAVRVGVVRTINGRNTALDGTALVPGITYAAGDALNVRTQVVGTAPATLRIKVWRVGTPEPASWTLTRTDTTAALQVAGAFGLSPYLATGSTNAPVEARYDDLVVMPLP